MPTVPFPTRDQIRANQLAAVRRMLDVVGRTNPFYGPILREAGLDGTLGDLETFCRCMPFTRKETIIDDQRQKPPYGTNLTYPLSDYCRFTQTSATRGAPLRWLDTQESWQWMLNCWKQVLTAAEVVPGDCLYFAFSFGPFLGFWTAFEAACQMGCRCLPGGGLSSLARLQAMRDNGAQVLCCTPTYALRLAEVAEAEKFDLADTRIRTIVVAGEPGGSVPAVRAQIERAWPQAVVFDHHGMTEIGPVSHQCPDRPCTLMVIESAYFAEILDPHGDAPVPRGEVGELVLTNLGRLGSPLIRYRTGDLVRENLDVAARGGRHEMALRGGILGRADDMLLIRGVNVYPAAVDDLLHSLTEIAQYQAVVDRAGPMVELRLRVEPADGQLGDEAFADRVRSRFRAAFNLRVPVTVELPGTLPRSEMKGMTWVRSGD